jgi:hypothetical protein
MIRTFDIRDIPTLRHYHNRGLFLDNVLTLTWGKGLIPARAMLLPFASAMGVFTSICKYDSKQTIPILGQVSHATGSPFSRLAFLAPDSAIDSPVLSPLLEHLICKVGERGAQNLTAEVDEKTQSFETLRGENFSIYARQRIWRLRQVGISSIDKMAWRNLISLDEINIRKLYNALVPALVQQVEMAPWNRGHGWVYYKDGKLLAFSEVVRGPRGIWLQPFVHPDMENADQHLKRLLQNLRPRSGRPIYVCLRSYQAWLSIVLEELGAEPGPPQAVMVRRLAAAVKKPALAPFPQINGSREPTTSFFENGSPER